MRRKEGKRAKWKEERIVREGDGGEAGHQRVYDDSEHNPVENDRSVQEDTDKNVTVPSVVKARRAGTGRNVVLPD